MAEVQAARVEKTGEKGWPWRPAQEDQARVWKKKAERETRLPVAKAPCPGVYENPAVQGIPEPAMKQEVGDSDVDMNNIPEAMKTKRGASAKKRICLWDVVKSEGDPMKIANEILNMQLSLTARKLLGLSPAVQKAFFGTHSSAALAGAKSEEVCVNRAELAYEEEDVLYLAGCPMIKVRIEGISVKALLDSGAEICVMGLDLARRAGLPYRSHSKLSMLGVTGKSSAFKGVCESVDVDMGGVIIDVPIFVLDNSDFDLILGRPFQRRG